MNDNGTAHSAALYRVQRLTTHGQCRTCGAPVLWAHKDEGGQIALDPKPHDGGTWGITPTGKAAYLGQTQVGAIRFLPHQATCQHPSRQQR
jgi:hypothetical protein